MDVTFFSARHQGACAAPPLRPENQEQTSSEARQEDPEALPRKVVARMRTALPRAMHTLTAPHQPACTAHRSARRVVRRPKLNNNGSMCLNLPHPANLSRSDAEVKSVHSEGELWKTALDGTLYAHPGETRARPAGRDLAAEWRVGMRNTRKMVRASSPFHAHRFPCYVCAHFFRNFPRFP